MTVRADCTDCAWSIEGEDIVEVSDAMDDHAQKEQHHINLKRRVATDGGDEAWGVEQRGLDGNRAEGQARLDGGIQKPGGEGDE